MPGEGFFDTLKAHTRAGVRFAFSVYPFCYKNASTSGIFIDDAIIIRIERLIHNNIHNILLTGGEPTLHPHYLRYISLFSEYADVHMITNGSILYEHDAQELAKLKLIQFSIYGCDNAEYLKMTGMNDGFTRLVKSIEFVHSNSIHSILSLTICEETIDRIESFVQTAIGLNMSYLRIGIADRFGRGKYLYGNHNDFDRKKDSILHLILELKRKYRNRITIEISNIEKDHVSDHYDIYNNIHRGSLKCGCGSEYLVISHEGKLRPCQQLPERWFSIKSNTALEEHISGNFHIDQLYQNAHEYCVQEQKSGYDLPPCFALEDLMFKQNI